MNQDQDQAEAKSYTIKDFFEEIPPGQVIPISNIAFHSLGSYHLTLPELNLHCDNDTCHGFRLFQSKDQIELFGHGGRDVFLDYTCKNCGKRQKTYALYVLLDENKKTGTLYKYGELPDFGPPTPSRVVSVLGAEKEYYFKGRRAENQGLGIAAHAYYRRVVENQKNKIFDEIIRTVKVVNPDDAELLKELEAAKRETQFTKAVDSIKHGIPQALLINGHNPLTLLHGALSEGLHAKTDEECLEIATSIRVILADLVERMANAVKDTAELKTAVNRILQRKK